ncbi:MULTISPECIES: ABC transporter ATP-binding protein [Aminobacterium]|jgi:peptide/nickel transport system ATP-binding protein|uniref:ABC transporter ATP-binding protein n=1 Tax=Aminobacterium TaxID=81466 RepID=UPI0004637706|nr:MULTISPECIES: oligopeptide/dipeptide ABC transporter ATP-binding protein [Aminobacterium]
MNSTERLLEVRGLKKFFKTKKGILHAVDNVSFDVHRGETLGLVGESGCGKSTLGRVVIRLLDATGGQVFYNGEDILKYRGQKLWDLRRVAQIVFQDPYSSLNPRMSVSSLIAEPLEVNNICKGAEKEARIRKLMDTVGLAQRLYNAYPHELDGGRRQRIGIARALALEPEFIVLDEPVSALDVCIQAQILNLLIDLQEDMGYTYIFISHDLSVVKHISDRIAVMYLGCIVEMAGYQEIFDATMHPYTKALLSAIPIPKFGVKRERILLEGDVPSPINPPEGCRFAGRCHYKKDLCMRKTPELREMASGHFVACHFAEELFEGRKN